MELLKFVRFSMVLVSMVSGKRINPDDDIKQLTNNQISLLSIDPTQGQLMCSRLSKEPNFEVEMLFGRTWRIYYTWNIDYENRCIDMVFRNVTPSIINRIYNDMSEYMVSEPYWDGATMLASMGSARHEMLLFADQGDAGRFQGIPNIIRDGKMAPQRKTVQLLSFHLKLMYGDKYLLMADCQIGVILLSASRRSTPYRAEIAGVADSLGFGPGLQACMADKNLNEIIPNT